MKRLRLVAVSALAVVALVLAACQPATPTPKPPAPPAATTAAPSLPTTTPAPAQPAKPTAAPTTKPTPAPTAKPAPAEDAAQFYAGKTVTVVESTAPGGGIELLTRAMARHLGRLIPGNPSVIVTNMPGAGGRLGANYVYSAKPDGLILGRVATVVSMEYISGLEGIRYDPKHFVWLGNLSGGGWLFYVRTDSPWKTFADIKAKPEQAKIGAPEVGSTQFYRSRVVEEAMGVRFKHILGLPAPEIDLAIMRGEIEGRTNSLGVVWQRNKEWLEKGFIRVMAQSSPERHPLFPDVPSIYELVPEKDHAKLRGALTPTDWYGPYVFPPGVPEDRVKAVRDAFTRIAKDEAFLADVKRADLEYSLYPVGWEQVESYMREVLSYPPDVLAFYKNLSTMPK
ncbi:MAG: hypothetical protein HY673_16330 [Chloroflexi bacterium]|nr:hypothetical protein [Chloroflexota bacterium]